MTRVYKICLLLAVLVLIFAFGNFAWAQGYGYFLEKGQEFFIFDNLYINGFLAVEDTLTTKIGLFGDALVGDTFNLDATKSFNFCKDTRQLGSNAPLNKDCADKVLIWDPTSLNVVNNDFYQLQVNNIQIAGSTLEFTSAASTGTINTKSPVRLTGCFSNATGTGVGNCNTGEFKTNKLYLQSFSSQNPNGEVILSPNNLIFNHITLDSNLGNQNLCTKVSASSACPAGSGSAKNLPFSGGLKICCNLNISY